MRGPRERIPTHLHDMLAEIDLVAEMLVGFDQGRFCADMRTRRAVERSIEIISEASRRISAAEKEAFPDVPWRTIAAIGNIMRHEYQRVVDDYVWATATRSVPELRPVIVALLAAKGR